jgi:hypothetical protein
MWVPTEFAPLCICVSKSAADAAATALHSSWSGTHFKFRKSTDALHLEWLLLLLLLPLLLQLR